MRIGHRRLSVGWIVASLPVIGYALAILVPLYYVVVSAFKSNAQIALAPLALPTDWSPHRFGEAATAVQLVAAEGNSLGVAVGSVLLTLVLAAPAAHALARSTSRLGKAAQLTFALGFLIPTFAVLVPTYLLAVRTGLVQQPLVFLVLFYAAMNLPAAVLLLLPFFSSVPKEIEETAELDGATRGQRMRHVLVPIVLPGLSTVGILNFLAAWNEYIFAQVLTNNTSYTVQVALPQLQNMGAFQGADVDLGRVAAGVVLSVIPVFVVYAILRRRLIDAFAAGAVKG